MLLSNHYPCFLPVACLLPVVFVSLRKPVPPKYLQVLGN